MLGAERSWVYAASMDDGWLKTSNRVVRVVLLALLAAVAQAQPPVPPGFHGYPLRHRQAAEVVPQLRQLLQGVADASQVLVDDQSNRVLVQGTSQSQSLVAQFLQTLDQPAGAESQASPEPAEVKGYRVESGDLKALASRLQAAFGREAGVRIAVDERTRQILVVASPAVQSRVAAWVNKEPHAKSQPSPGLPSSIAASRGGHQLQNISWKELEDHLRRLWGSQIDLQTTRNGELATVVIATPNGIQPVLEIDRRQERVAAVGSSQAGPNWLQIVRVLDSPRSSKDELTQLVPVRHADPAKVQSAISLIRAAGSGEKDQVTTVARRVGSGTTPRWGGELLSMIFQQEGAPAGGAAPAGPPAAAPATPEALAVAGEPGQAAAGEDSAEGEEGGLMGPVQIEFLEGLDMIVVRGNKRDVDRVLRIIEDIEKMSVETQPIVEVYVLKNVNCEALTDLITAVYTEILSPRQGQVTIRALVEPNAILIIGREENVETIRALIRKLDQPMDPSSQFGVFRLKHISAIDAETTVRSFFVDRPGTEAGAAGAGAAGDRPGLGTQVRIIGDYRSNSLIVQASPRDLGEVQRLVESIDVEEGQATAVIRVFRLKNALAEDMATTLQSAISGQVTRQQPGQQVEGAAGAAGGAAGGATQARSNLPSTVLEFMMVDQEKGRLLRSGILANAQVTADANINAVVVRAPAKSMDLIAALIEQLDQLPDAQAQIKVFTIMNGDATNLTVMLQQLFGQQVTAGSTGGGLFGATGLAGLLQPQLQSAAGAGESSLVPLRFAVDVRTNSIIASGSEGDLNVVEALLLRLDEGDIESRRLSVVRLKNAPAADVATALTNFLTSQRTLIQQRLLTSQVISPYEQIEQEVIIVAEAVTNSLIISATPQYYDQIMKVIQDLDFRPPMVMVQVLIAEVQLDEVFQFGVEWGLQDSLLFDRGIATTPASAHTPGFNFNNTGLPNLNAVESGVIGPQGLTNLGLGRTNGTLGYGGLVLSAASESVNILVRALQDTGRLQVLSRPQVMTLNNQIAFVQVGATQSRITGTTITQGIVQNNVTDIDTGLILRIQPLINDDGVVVMNVDAERSKLGSEADGVTIAFGPAGEPIRSPPIDRTTAQTTVSARSGQTVVFAGLITKDKVLDLRRVPYLADIPMLGRLFEFRSTAEQRKELMIILTPHIIKEDADYEWIKMVESERMSWCLSDVVELHGDVGLQGGSCLFCDHEVSLIYPDEDPTGGYVVQPPLATPDGSEMLPSAPAPPFPAQKSGHRILPAEPIPAVPSDEAAGTYGGQPPTEVGAARLGQRPAPPLTYRTAVSYGPAPGNGVQAAQYMQQPTPLESQPANPPAPAYRLPSPQ